MNVSTTSIPSLNIPRDDNHEVRVKIALRNNRLISLREKEALTQSGLAKKVGARAMDINAMECLRYKEITTRNGTFKSCVTDVCLYFGVSQEWLFPEALSKVKIADIVVTGDVEKLPSYLIAGDNSCEPLLPSKEFDKKELAQQLKKILSMLTVRQEQVLRLLYFSDMNLDEVGKELGISRGRVRQIEAHALRMLRHPSRNKYIKAFEYESI